MSLYGITVLVNGVETSSISVNDRGLAYGDGLFETLRVRDRKIPLWPYHRARLESGCRRLGIQPCFDSLEAELQQLLNAIGQSVRPDSLDQLIKIMITRGPGERGYSPEGADTPSRILIHSEYTVASDRYYKQGVSVRVCSTRLGCNPLLAGIKHLNRLEQVLARSEWRTELYTEGLMCDQQGCVVDGTMSNFFVVTGGELCTSDLAQAGVAGVMRRFILEHSKELGFTCNIGSVALDDLFSAKEMFVCNSIFGVWPVRLLSDETSKQAKRVEWSDGFPAAKAIQSLVNSKLFPQ